MGDGVPKALPGTSMSLGLLAARSCALCRRAGLQGCRTQGRDVLGRMHIMGLDPVNFDPLLCICSIHASLTPHHDLVTCHDAWNVGLAYVQVGTVTERYESQAAELRSELSSTQGQRDVLQGQLDITTARLQVGLKHLPCMSHAARASVMHATCGTCICHACHMRPRQGPMAQCTSTEPSCNGKLYERQALQHLP